MGFPSPTQHVIAPQAARSVLRYYLAATALSLYQFTLFKLIGFYVIPVNFLLCFLLIGHPIGVLVGLRYYKHRLDAALAHSGGLFLAGFAGFYVLQAFQSWSMSQIVDNVTLVYVLAMIVVTAAVFLPSFVAAGAIEYGIIDEAYDRGIPFGAGYATLLFGAVSGLVLGYAFLPRGGLVATILLVFAMIAIALENGVIASGADQGRRTMAAVLAVAAAASAGRAGLDEVFLQSILPYADFTARAAIERDVTPIYQTWGKYAHVILLRDGDRIEGAYNNIPFWTTFQTYDPANDFIWDRASMSVVRPGGRVAILGSGGGRQIHTALRQGNDLKIDAFEIEPAVVDYFQSIAPEHNGNVFLHPRVRSLAIDARKGVASSPEPYDCIFAASAGSFFTYYKNLLLNMQLLYTREAFSSYVAKLKRDGFIALHINRFLFDHGMGQRIVNQMVHFGLETGAWRDETYGFVLGAYPEHFDAYKTRLERIFATDPAVEPLQLAADFTVVNALPTDDWNGYFIFSLLGYPTLAAGFAIIFGIVTMLLAGGVRGAAVHLAPRLGAQPRELALWLAQALVLGVNFILLENMLIYEMTKVLLDVTDAVIIGSVLFLVPAALGALLGQGRTLRLAKVLHYGAVAVALAALSSRSIFPSLTLFAAGIVVFFTSGTLFPLLLRRADIGRTPYVFAADALGAALGTLLVFFVPLLYGIAAFSAAALLCSALAGAFVFFVGSGRDGELVRRTPADPNYQAPELSR